MLKGLLVLDLSRHFIICSMFSLSTACQQRVLRVQQILPRREQTMIYNKDQAQFRCGIKNEVGFHSVTVRPRKALESLRPRQQSTRTSVALGGAGSSWHEWTWFILELRLQCHWSACNRYKGHLWRSWFKLVALSFSQADTLCTFLSFTDSFFILSLETLVV